jgi:uncharacterized protein YhhL (DUF1145 family)
MQYIIEAAAIASNACHLFNMSPALLVGFAIYFSAQLCVASFLLFMDGMTYHRLNGASGGRDYRWEKTLAIVFGVLQMSLSIAGLAGIIVAFCSSRDMCDWIQAGVMSSLQLGTGTNVRQLTLYVRTR